MMIFNDRDQYDDFGLALSRFISDCLIPLGTKYGEGFCSYGTYALQISGNIPRTMLTPVEVPANVSLYITGDCPNSAPIINSTGTDYPIRFLGGTGERHFGGIKNVSLVRGGVEVHRHRGRFDFSDSICVEAPDKGLRTIPDASGQGPVRYHVDRVIFGMCNGGVYIEAATHNVGYIRECEFFGSTGVPLYIDAPGVTVRDCDFTAAEARAFIQFAGTTDRSSINKVTGCRFGSEDITDHTSVGSIIPTPDYDILIGEESGPNITHNGAGYWFTQNEHLGRENSTKPGALAAYGIFDRPNRLQIFRNYFSPNKYQNSLIDDDYAGSPLAAHFHDNLLAPTDATPIFKNGGAGWSVR